MERGDNEESGGEQEGDREGEGNQGGGAAGAGGGAAGEGSVGGAAGAGSVGGAAPPRWDPLTLSELAESLAVQGVIRSNLAVWRAILEAGGQ